MGRPKKVCDKNCECKAKKACKKTKVSVDVDSLSDYRISYNELTAELADADLKIDDLEKENEALVVALEALDIDKQELLSRIESLKTDKLRLVELNDRLDAKVNKYKNRCTVAVLLTLVVLLWSFVFFIAW